MRPGTIFKGVGGVHTLVEVSGFLGDEALQAFVKALLGAVRGAGGWLEVYEWDARVRRILVVRNPLQAGRVKATGSGRARILPALLDAEYRSRPGEPVVILSSWRLEDDPGDVKRLLRRLAGRNYLVLAAVKPPSGDPLQVPGAVRVELHL